MNSMLARRVAPLFVTTVLVAAPAWAQTTTAPSAAPTTSAPSATTAPDVTAPDTNATGGGHAGAMHGGTSHSAATVTRRPGESLESMVDRRITQLHTQLHITPAQSSQWDQFAQVMRDNAKAMDQMYADRAGKLSGMSAVDNMQSFEAIVQARAEGMQKLVPAFQAVYASLSDQQKQQADALFRYQAAKAETTHKPAAAAHQG